MKLVGTGNDFLFIDARQALPGEFGRVSRAEIVRRLCDRHFGLGADGVVFVESAADHFRWDFYNTDGSHAEMCGNATRCFGRWAALVLGRSRIKFETLAGHVTVSVGGGEAGADLQSTNVSSFLDFVSAHPKLMHLKAAGREVAVYWIDTGVPHFVAKVDSIATAQKDLDIIQALRFHEDGGPRGANVTFLKVNGPTSFETVTYERGVEDFTLSCGTGVIAAAAVGLQMARQTALGPESRFLEADVAAPGGRLRVRFEPGFEGVTLIGPAVKVFETNLDASILKD